ncbi:hypothetical protein B0H67DRAFT_119526 [Lasiosphaeris hirsuta]|uniref:Uncharacterized protein n=1 Tax=Lasiosphaeris hirsuta TaxID=260670 RepID=A0AA40E1Z4_9PEZI|nr:hypothetical protein B0H67DRAFT_119526 [Lasiosphaeris hirsuta]
MSAGIYSALLPLPGTRNQAPASHSAVMAMAITMATAATTPVTAAQDRLSSRSSKSLRTDSGRRQRFGQTSSWAGRTGHMGLPTRRSPFKLHKLEPDTSQLPILWPTELKSPPPADRLAGLEWSMPTNTLFFTKLNYDVRRAIYDVMLADIGTRQNIFCPSITRSTQAKELFSQYLVSKKCDGPTFKTALACGHSDCDEATAGDDGETASEYRMADLIALMGTCKFGSATTQLPCPRFH